MAFTVLRGGRVLDIAAGSAAPADVLIDGDTIREVAAPGAAVPEGAAEIDVSGHLLHPGLVNAHTHAHGNLSKGMGDRWTLELLLSAAPFLSGHRTTEDKYLTAQLGAVEMVLKGCTACYDLFFEWPLPSRDGLAAAAAAYADVGMRAVIAPMVADRTMYEAIPGLAAALPEGLRERVAGLRLAPAAETLAAIRDAFARWSSPQGLVGLAVAPTIPQHCSDGFILGCAEIAREFGVGLPSHVAESKVRGPAWRRWLTTREAALAATEGSARALGFGDRIGRIAPGWKADIVMLDLGHPNWLPLNDPVNQLVHCEDGTAVDHVMIGGRMVVRDRRVLTVDLVRLRQRVAEARERLLAANADNRRLYDALEPVVGSYCPGLAASPYHVHRYGAHPG